MGRADGWTTKTLCLKMPDMKHDNDLLKYQRDEHSEKHTEVPKVLNFPVSTEKIS